MMNVTQIQPEQCCGCSACSAICPKDAIVMTPDAQGFLYPAVDEGKCVDCGLCLRVCHDAQNRDIAPVGAYAAKNTDRDALKRSSSGGVAYALCQQVITQGGAVYGVAYDENHRVITCRADTLEGCEAFFGSKYVQTDPCGTFRQVSTDLKEGRTVLYFGTSCHIAGLLSYCSQKHCQMDKLITVDLICHGVPSPGIFSDYMAFLKKDPRFTGFAFRTKERPWGYGSANFGCTIYHRGGRKKTDSVEARLFLDLFFSNNCLRPHCYECKHASLDKPADITIADYWGLQDAHPEFFSEDGVSAVIVHSEKGEALFKSAELLTYIESTTEAIARKQANIGGSSPKSPNYDAFWKLYHEKGFLAVAKRYGGLTMKRRIKTFLRRQGILK